MKTKSSFNSVATKLADAITFFQGVKLFLSGTALKLGGLCLMAVADVIRTKLADIIGMLSRHAGNWGIGSSLASLQHMLQGFLSATQVTASASIIIMLCGKVLVALGALAAAWSILRTGIRVLAHLGLDLRPAGRLLRGRCGQALTGLWNHLRDGTRGILTRWIRIRRLHSAGA